MFYLHVDICINQMHLIFILIIYMENNWNSWEKQEREKLLK